MKIANKTLLPLPRCFIQLIYGPLAWCALLFGTAHVYIMGFQGWSDTSKWPGGMPPITMTATILPMLVMVLKLVEIVVTFASYVFGREKTRSEYGDLTYVRTLIQAGAMTAEGNDSDKSDSTSTTVSHNNQTGDFEIRLNNAESKV